MKFKRYKICKKKSEKKSLTFLVIIRISFDFLRGSKTQISSIIISLILFRSTFKIKKNRLLAWSISQLEQLKDILVLKICK